MIGISMDCLTNAQTSSKSNLNQQNKNLNSSFEQIFDASKKETNNFKNKNVSKLHYNNAKRSTSQQYNRKEVKNISKDINDDYKANSQIEDSDTSIKESLVVSIEEQIDNGAAEENEAIFILDEDETVQDLHAINELLSSFISAQLNSETLNCDGVVQNEVLYNEISSSEAFVISNKLNDAITSLETLLNQLNNLDESETVKISQQLQGITKIIEDGNLEKLEPAFLNELKSHIDVITKSIKELSEPLDSVKLNDTNETNLVDDKDSFKSIYHENEQIDTNLNSDKSKIKIEHFMDNQNTSKESFDVSKALNNFASNQNLKSDEHTSNLFEIATSTEKSINDSFIVNKNNIFEQIVDKIKVDYKDIRDEIKIKLKPEILGEMTIKIVVEKGTVTAKAIVESYQIKQLLDSNIEQLKDSFREQGISFQALDVSVNKDPGFDRNSAESWVNSKRNKQRKIKVEDIGLSDIYEEINIQNSGNLNTYSNSLNLIV